jgi:hypothetical protein
MHQLTKSPDHYVKGATRTAHSEPIRYDLFAVRRYLDYCAELLAIVGKTAVLYVEDATDPVVLDAVDQIENLTTSLSRKIWQKLVIFNEIAAEARSATQDDSVDSTSKPREVDQQSAVFKTPDCIRNDKHDEQEKHQ